MMKDNNRMQQGVQPLGRRPLPPSKPLPVKHTPLWVWLFFSFSCMLIATVTCRYGWQKSKQWDAALAQQKALAERDELARKQADEAEGRAQAEKDRAYMKCRGEDNIPVMMFGPKVGCIKKESFAWEQQ